MTLGLTSLPPHAIVPSLLSDEGKRIVLPAFFQRGRDTSNKTRQTLATAHRSGPTRRSLFRGHGSRYFSLNAASGTGAPALGSPAGSGSNQPLPQAPLHPPV